MCEWRERERESLAAATPPKRGRDTRLKEEEEEEDCEENALTQITSVSPQQLAQPL